MSLLGGLQSKHNLMIVNEDRQKRDPTFTPIFFHALSDETKISRHLRPKFAEKSTFPKETNFNLFFTFNCFFTSKTWKNILVIVYFYSTDVPELLEKLVLV